MLRAQWGSDILGEEKYNLMTFRGGGMWDVLAMFEKKVIVEKAKAAELATVDEDLGEANESKVKKEIELATVTAEDRKIAVGGDGTITIPAVACSKPTKSTGKIRFMKSNLGGMQLHYSRNWGPEGFEYTFDASAAGKYTLTARVVTPSWKQHLFVAANGAEEPVDIALQFTVGMWDKTKPVEITLVKGKNVLCFSHKSEGYAKGVTIKDFTLTPVK